MEPNQDTKSHLSARRPAVFLDRDGTLIVDVGYPKDPARVERLSGAAEAMRTLQQAGYALIVISNQSGIARGIITPQQAQAVHDRFLEVFAQESVHFEGVYYCPHGSKENCACRKPQPGLLRQAVDEHGLDPRQSFVVGDKLSDIQAGKAIGCRGVLLRSCYVDDPGDLPDFVVSTWKEALQAMIGDPAR